MANDADPLAGVSDLLSNSIPAVISHTPVWNGAYVRVVSRGHGSDYGYGACGLCDWAGSDWENDSYLAVRDAWQHLYSEHGAGERSVW